MKQIIENRINNIKVAKQMAISKIDKLIAEGKIELLQSILDEYKAQQTEPVTYKIGQRFKHRGSGEYILAQTEMFKINLINLKSGNRYGTTTKVKDTRKITEQELGEVLEEDRSCFELLEK